MIGEITLALGVAEKAFNAIKTAKERHDDLSDMGATLSKFLTARDVVSEAKAEAQAVSSGKTIEEQALEIALANKKIREYDQAIREMFIWSGEAETYHDMMRQRRRLKEIKQQEERLAAKRKSDVQDIIIGVIAVSIVVAAMIGMAYMIKEVSAAPTEVFYL